MRRVRNHFPERPDGFACPLVEDREPQHILHKNEVFRQVDILPVEIKHRAAQRVRRIAGADALKAHDHAALVHIAFHNPERVLLRVVKGVKTGQHLGGIAPGLYFHLAGHAVGVNDFPSLQKAFFHKSILRKKSKTL